MSFLAPTSEGRIRSRRLSGALLWLRSSFTSSSTAFRTGRASSPPPTPEQGTEQEKARLDAELEAYEIQLDFLYSLPPGENIDRWIRYVEKLRDDVQEERNRLN